MDPHSIPKGLLTVIWNVVSRRPGGLLLAGILLAILSAAASFLYLGLDSDQDSLVSPDVPFHKRYLEHLQNFGDQEYLYVVIRASGTAEGREMAILFAEDLAYRLAANQELFETIHFQMLSEELGDGLLLFASLEEAEALSDAVITLSPQWKAWMQDASLEGFFSILAHLMKEEEGAALTALDADMLNRMLGLLSGLFQRMDQTLSGQGPFPSVLELTPSRSHYFFTEGDQLLIMRLLPVKDYGTLDVIGKPLRILREALEDAREAFPQVEAGLTGRPVLQADEMETTDRDMTRAAILSVCLVGLMFMVVLHGWLRPLIILSSLIMAMAWSFGFATVTVGKLNLLSIVFALVLVGIGVDFGVHMVVRYLEAIKSGLGGREAVHTALFRTGPGIMLGAVTSVCAFYAVVFSDFVGLAQLGLIGGTGVLLCLLAMITVLPAMLLLAGKKRLFPKSPPRISAMPFLERFSKRPWLTLFLLGGLTAAGLPGLLRVGFDYNLLELQSQALESVRYERELIEASEESTWYAILTRKSLPEVASLVQTLKSLDTVAKVESILDFIPQDQERKRVLYGQALQALEGIPVQVPPVHDPDPERTKTRLRHLDKLLSSLEEKLFSAGAGPELATVQETRAAMESAMKRMQEDPSSIKHLRGFASTLAQDLGGLVGFLKKELGAEPVGPENIPPAIQDLFVGKDGAYQIKITPKEDVWDFDKLTEFVAELREVDPLVSGVPVGVLESARLMHRTFLMAAGVTICLVALLLYGYARSIRYVCLILLPLAIGMLWLLILMGWLGLQFNLANFFAIPILIAIGVDGAIHLLARFREIRSTPGNETGSGGTGLFLTSTPTAVSLSFATTMIGFGGLLFAHHQGLASLGWVMVLGSAMGLLACILALPPVLKLVGPGPREGESP